MEVKRFEEVAGQRWRLLQAKCFKHPAECAMPFKYRGVTNLGPD